MTPSRLLFIGLLTIGASTASARDRLQLQTTPRVSYAPSNLTIRATIDPSDEYRVIEVIADSGTYVRSSEVQLNGARAARVTVFEFNNVPGGVYDVTAAVKNERGDILARADQEVRVIASPKGN